MSSFDDALRHAQSAHQRDTASQADEDAQMTAIARRIYGELETASQGAFRAIAEAGAEVVHAYTEHPNETLGNAVALLATSGERNHSPHRGLWALERGGISYSDSYFKHKPHWLTGNARAVLREGRHMLEMSGQSTIRVIRSAPVYKLWSYPNAGDAFSALIVEYDIVTQQTKIRHESSTRHYESFRGNGVAATPTDYIAQLTAVRLSELC